MLKKIAEIISLILNPIFLALVLVLLGIEKSHLGQNNLMLFTVFALTVNGLLPFGFVYYFIQKGKAIDDILGNKEVLKNRSFVLACALIILLLETLLLYLFQKPQPLFAILTVLLFLVLALFVVNFYGKISIHMAMTTVLCLTILALFGFSFWPILFLLPIVAWSRLYLLKHTKKQLFAGFLVASIIAYFVIFYLYSYS